MRPSEALGRCIFRVRPVPSTSDNLETLDATAPFHVKHAPGESSISCHWPTSDSAILCALALPPSAPSE